MKVKKIKSDIWLIDGQIVSKIGAENYLKNSPHGAMRGWMKQALKAIEEFNKPKSQKEVVNGKSKINQQEGKIVDQNR